MLVILFFFMSIFAVLGFHIFTADKSAQYFDTFYDSFVNLFVLLTTSNFPDVMMPYYARSKWAAFFFVIFLLVHLYFLMNLLLAVVYERFSSLEKEKFRKLLLHRRKACQQAFRLLVNRATPSSLYFVHFEGLMKYLKPRAKRQDVYLMFKTMDVDRKGFLNKDDFLQIYGACTLTWERQWSDSPWFCELKRPFERKLFQGAYKLATCKWTHMTIYTVIAASFVWHIIEAAEMSSGHTSFFGEGKSGISAWVLVGVLIFYILEMFLKMSAFGIGEYFHHSWNKFDFVIITVTVVVGCIGTFLNLNLLRIVVIRSLRLLRLFKLRKRYHDVLGTVFILMPRFTSVSLVLIIVYYFFAIIGIECFAGYRMEDCCRNTTVELYYATSSNSSGAGYYYLTNFDNIVNGYVTLFVLMAVNNWFIIMDGYAAVASEFSRLFFVSFYLITMIVLQIVVAFVLEAFIFRIQYKTKIGDKREDSLIKVEMRLSKAEIAFCTKPRGSSLLGPLVYPSVAEQDTLCFRGTHWRTKFSFCLKMYAEEVKEWLDRAEYEEASSSERATLNPQTSDGNSLQISNLRRTFTL
uniref:Putative two pore calcium channel protein n=1 Tax=Ornithodoros turicata TaxID=34597 RepID=A0A2R5L484_9ACAR